MGSLIPKNYLQEQSKYRRQHTTQRKIMRLCPSRMIVSTTSELLIDLRRPCVPSLSALIKKSKY